jgi:hypothetical protein
MRIRRRISIARKLKKKMKRMEKISIDSFPKNLPLH